MDSLRSLHIYTLPDQDEVPGMYSAPNISRVNIEIADANQYRFYSYEIPYRSESFKETRYLSEIFRLLQTQLGFQLLEQRQLLTIDTLKL